MNNRQAERGKEVTLEVLSRGDCVLRCDLWEYILIQFVASNLAYIGSTDDLQIVVYVDGERIAAKQPEAMEDDS